MESDTLVDILLTTYNTNEQYLREQIESLINQTHNNIKIYISDDASNDNRVLEILNEYKKKDSRIIVYTQEQNRGYNKNFEFLMKQSTADYIMFCDHDDVWHKDKVKKSLEKIIKSNCSLVYCNCRQIDENSNLIKSNYFKTKNIPLIEKKSKLAISRYAGLGCSQIITKSVKEKMLPFKESVMAHDWLAGFVANEQKGIKYIYEELFDYRLHTNNVFGGRSLNQNINKWKEQHGNTYKSFKEYREDVINRAYLSGAKMCLDYAESEKNIVFLKKIIKYYNSILKTKVINIRIIEYFKFLGGKNLAKKMCKEVIIFHFPLLAYLVFKSR